MRLYLGAAFTALVLSFANAQTCKSLTDSDSPLLQSLALLFNVTQADIDQMPVDQVLGPLDKAYPAASKCIGSMNAQDLMQQVAADNQLQTCMGGLSALNMPRNETSMHDMNAMIDSFVCPLYKDTIYPCVNDFVLKHLETTMQATNGCCDDLNSEFQASYGSSMREMVKTLMGHVGNIMCSKKKYTDANNKEVEVTCGYSIMMMFQDAMKAGKMLDMVQVSHSGACSAMTGQEFSLTDTKASKAKMSFTLTDPTGICYKPVDALLDTIANYPVVKSMTMTAGSTTIRLADLFEPDKCVKGEDVVTMVLSDGSPLMKYLKMVDDTVASAGPMMGGSGNASSSYNQTWAMPPKHNHTHSDNSTESSGSSDTHYMVMNKTMHVNATDMVRMMLEKYKPKMAEYCFNVPHGVAGSCDFGSASIVTAFQVSQPTTAPSADSGAMMGATVSMVSMLAVMWATLMYAA